MRIEGCSAAFPSRTVDNDEILHLIRTHSAPTYAGDLDDLIKRIRFYLNYSGIQTRQWLGEGENPIGLLTRAVQNALDEAERTLDDIDMVVSTGVDRGFVEPAGAYMVADALGLRRAQCFDVVDACNSWSRAMQIVDMMLNSGMVKTVLVVNAEFNLMEDRAVNPHLFAMARQEEIEWTFPAFTIGECATASVVTRDDSNPWEFHFTSRPDLSDLCTVPLPGYEGYCKVGLEDSPMAGPAPASLGAASARELRAEGLSRIGRNGANRFTSFGGTMFQEGFDEEVAIFRKLSVDVNDIKLVFPHAASRRLWDDMGAEVGIEGKLFHMYPEFGNLVSASVPAGIATAKDRGLVERGDLLVGWVGSAGMSFSAYAFRW